jgi:hypothetical protein
VFREVDFGVIETPGMVFQDVDFSVCEIPGMVFREADFRVWRHLDWRLQTTTMGCQNTNISIRKYLF